MLKEGVLSRPPRVQMVYGQHIWPTLPSGVIASRSGPIFAAAGFFSVTMSGGGGHAAMPHATNDTVLAVAQCISMLQSIVARSLDPVKGGGVVSVTKMSGGNAYNVIPAGKSRQRPRLLPPPPRDVTLAARSCDLRRHHQGAESGAVRHELSSPPFHFVTRRAGTPLWSSGSRP